MSIPFLDTDSLELLFASLAHHYPVRCTVEENIPTYSDTGEERSGGWQPVANLEDLPCEVAPITTSTQQEIKPGNLNSQPLAISSHRIAFPAVHPINTTQRLVITEGPFSGIYDINRPDAGSIIQTVIEARKVS
jgi:hypothetical protein